MERNGAALLSIQPRNLHVTTENVYTLERGSLNPVTLVKDGNTTYLRIKLDIYWAHARGKKGFGIILGERYMNASPGIDFYLPVNPWHYATSILHKVSGSMRTEEDIRLIIQEHNKTLAKILENCSLQQCPGLTSKTFDGEPAFQFRIDTYLQHCKDKISLLAATNAIRTTSRAIEFATQFFDSEIIRQLRRDFAVVEDAQPRSPPKNRATRAPHQTVSARQSGSKQRVAPKIGPIDAFLRAMKK